MRDRHAAHSTDRSATAVPAAAAPPSSALHAGDDRRPSDLSNARHDLTLAAERAEATEPFVVAGTISVIAGGLIAALTRPTGFTLGPWVAAYLVLVGGVAQIALGGGQALLAERPPPAALVRLEFVVWNLAVAAVLVGTLVPVVTVTMVGGVVTGGALVLFLGGVRRVRSSPRWALNLYRGVGLFVLLSTPVGLVLAWLRHG